MDTESYTKVDNYKKEKKGTVTNQTVTVNTTVIGTTVQTDVTEKQTDKHRDWRYSYLYQLIDIDGDDGGGKGGKGGDGLTEIDDEDVPLADAPKTGDITGVLALISLFSAGGLLVLNRKRDEE